MLRDLRKRWLCWRYKLCPVHGTLLQNEGYNGGWRCSTCVVENAAKWMRVNTTHELNRVRAQERLNRDWAIGHGDGISLEESKLPPITEDSPQYLQENYGTSKAIRETQGGE